MYSGSYPIVFASHIQVLDILVLHFFPLVSKKVNFFQMQLLFDSNLVFEIFRIYYFYFLIWFLYLFV